MSSLALNSLSTLSTPLASLQTRVERQIEIRLGDRIPSLTLSQYEKINPENPSTADDNIKLIAVDAFKKFSEGMLVLFTLPLVFSAELAPEQFPDFMASVAKLYTLGEKIACISPSTQDVALKWKPANDPANKMMMLIDTQGLFCCEGLGIMQSQLENGFKGIAKSGIFVFNNGVLIYKTVQTNTNTCRVVSALRNSVLEIKSTSPFNH